MPPSTTVPALATALACAVLLCACASAQKPAEGISDAALQPREHVEELSADGLFAFGRADIALSARRAEAVRDYLNEEVRKIDPATLATPTIHTSLTSFKEGTVAQFCNNFLDLMMDARLIESIGSDLYRPTLLFAFEVKLNYDRQLEPFLTTIAPFDGATAVLTREVTIEESSNGRNY